MDCCFVIPAKAGIHCCFNALRFWMPDQVRHDRRILGAFLNYDTASLRRGSLFVLIGCRSLTFDVGFLFLLIPFLCEDMFIHHVVGIIGFFRLSQSF